MRVWMLSRRDNVADVAGTKEPICASRAMRAMVRTWEDLPPMFGPVIRRARVDPGAVERRVELGM